MVLELCMESVQAGIQYGNFKSIFMFISPNSRVFQFKQWLYHSSCCHTLRRIMCVSRIMLPYTTTDNIHITHQYTRGIISITCSMLLYTRRTMFISRIMLPYTWQITSITRHVAIHLTDNVYITHHVGKHWQIIFISSIMLLCTRQIISIARIMLLYTRRTMFISRIMLPYTRQIIFISSIILPHIRRIIFISHIMVPFTR